MTADMRPLDASVLRELLAGVRTAPQLQRTLHRPFTALAGVLERLEAQGLVSSHDQPSITLYVLSTLGEHRLEGRHAAP